MSAQRLKSKGYCAGKSLVAAVIDGDNEKYQYLISPHSCFTKSNAELLCNIIVEVSFHHFFFSVFSINSGGLLPAGGQEKEGRGTWVCDCTCAQKGHWVIGSTAVIKMSLV